MRVFESLNCIVCKQPFARVLDQPRTPVQLGCGLAMCDECFMKDVNSDKRERKHQCGVIDCFDNGNFAYFLIDSNELEAKKSFALRYGHIICTECCLKTRQKSCSHYYQIECPTCTVTYYTYTAVNKQKDRFPDFLNELPEMTRQMETIEAALMNAKDARSCNECHKKNIVDEMFHCSACSFEICGACAYVKHHSHGATPLLEKKANQMLMELQQESRNVINTYKDLVPKLHKGLLKGINVFETRLLSKEETLKGASNLADLQEKHEAFTKIKSKFESSAENYLPHLRRFDAEVKQLIQTLNETPDF